MTTHTKTKEGAALTVQAVEILADDHTKEGVEQKAMECGLALLEGGKIHLEKRKASEMFLKWLVHCGIPYTVVEVDLPAYKGRFAERISHALMIATVGRRALGID